MLVFGSPYWRHSSPLSAWLEVKRVAEKNDGTQDRHAENKRSAAIYFSSLTVLFSLLLSLLPISSPECFVASARVHSLPFPPVSPLLYIAAFYPFRVAAVADKQPHTEKQATLYALLSLPRVRLSLSLHFHFFSLTDFSFLSAVFPYPPPLATSLSFLFSRLLL